MCAPLYVPSRDGIGFPGSLAMLYLCTTLVINKNISISARAWAAHDLGPAKQEAEIENQPTVKDKLRGDLKLSFTILNKLLPKE